MDITKSMRQFLSNAEELHAQLQDSASPQVRQLRDKLESSITDMRRTLADKSETGAGRAQEATRAVVDYVQENPWVAVAAATAIGVALIYLVLARRVDS